MLHHKLLGAAKILTFVDQIKDLVAWLMSPDSLVNSRDYERAHAQETDGRSSAP